jgi:hypothetical protein
MLQSGKWDGRVGQFRSRKLVYLGMLGNDDEDGQLFDKATGESNSAHSVSNMPQVQLQRAS